MSEKTAKTLRKIQDRDLVQQLAMDKQELIAALNQRTSQLNSLASGLRVLGKKIAQMRVELPSLRFAIDQGPYIALNTHLEIYEEAFATVSGLTPGSRGYENAIRIAGGVK